MEYAWFSLTITTANSAFWVQILKNGHISSEGSRRLRRMRWEAKDALGCEGCEGFVRMRRKRRMRGGYDRKLGGEEAKRGAKWTARCDAG